MPRLSWQTLLSLYKDEGMSVQLFSAKNLQQPSVEVVKCLTNENFISCETESHPPPRNVLVSW